MPLCQRIVLVRPNGRVYRLFQLAKSLHRVNFYRMTFLDRQTVFVFEGLLLNAKHAAFKFEFKKVRMLEFFDDVHRLGLGHEIGLKLTQQFELEEEAEIRTGIVQQLEFG